MDGSQRMVLPLFPPRVEEWLANLRNDWPAVLDSAARYLQLWAHRRLDETRFERIEAFLARRVRKVWPEFDDAHLDRRISSALAQSAAARSPRVAAAWIKSITLGWSISHRLHRLPRACPFCDILDGDSQLHMLRDCQALRDLLRDAGVLARDSSLLAAVTLPSSKADLRVSIIAHHLYNKVAFGGLAAHAALRALCREFPPVRPLQRALRAT